MKKKIEEKELLKLFLRHECFTTLSDQDWKALLEHVATHKYFLDEQTLFENEDTPWHEAILSWYFKVYRPVRRVVMSARFDNAFPDLSKIQRFFLLSTHWFYMKKVHPDMTAAGAGNSYVAKYGKGLARFVTRILASLFPAGRFKVLH